MEKIGDTVNTVMLQMITTSLDKLNGVLKTHNDMLKQHCDLLKQSLKAEEALSNRIEAVERKIFRDL